MTNHRLSLVGWILFLVSATSFVVSSLRSGDLAGLLGAIFFFLGCAVFLVPFIRRDPQ